MACAPAHHSQHRLYIKVVADVSAPSTIAHALQRSCFIMVLCSAVVLNIATSAAKAPCVVAAVPQPPHCRSAYPCVCMCAAVQFPGTVVRRSGVERAQESGDVTTPHTTLHTELRLDRCLRTGARDAARRSYAATAVCDDGALHRLLTLHCKLNFLLVLACVHWRSTQLHGDGGARRRHASPTPRTTPHTELCLILYLRTGHNSVCHSYAATAVYDDGALHTAHQLKAAEYGCTLDPVSQLLARALTRKREGGAQATHIVQARHASPRCYSAILLLIRRLCTFGNRLSCFEVRLQNILGIAAGA
jgi:hypothetical protein